MWALLMAPVLIAVIGLLAVFIHKLLKSNHGNIRLKKFTEWSHTYKKIR